MKKNIVITHGSNGTLDIVTNLLTELGVPYEGVTGETNTSINYFISVEVPLYTKWLGSGFLENLDIEHHRQMSELFEHLGSIMLQPNLRTYLNNNYDSNDDIVGEYLFPIVRQVYLNLVKSNNTHNIEISTIIKDVTEIYLNEVGGITDEIGERLMRRSIKELTDTFT